VWYFTPFYSMLRATTDQLVWVFIALIGLATAFAVVKGLVKGLLLPVVVGAAVVAMGALYVFEAKFWGVVVMGGSTMILFGLPWLDRSPAKSIRYRPDWHKWLYAIFVVNFFVLGWLGIQPPSVIGERVSQIGTLYYFGFFLLMPWWSAMGEFKAVPDRVTFQPH
jgi:ubiquinol-cytochrome c reductase cytochrome b subunit